MRGAAGGRAPAPAAAWRRWGLVLVGAVYVVVPLVLTSRTRETFLLPKEVALRSLAALVVALFIIHVWRGGQVRPPLPLALPLAGLALVGLVSLWWTASPGAAQFDALNLVVMSLYYVALLWLLERDGARGDPAPRLLVVTWAVAAVTALVGLLQYIGLQPLFLFNFVGNVDRKQVFSTFGNPNMMAGYLAPLVPVGWVLVRRTSSALGRWLGSRALLLMIIAIVLSGTRSAWLGLLAAGILFGFLAPGGRARLGRLIVVALLLAGLVVGLAQMGRGERSESLVHRVTSVLAGSGGAGGRARIMEWLVTLDMIREHPLRGLGLGSFQIEFLDYRAQFLARPGSESFLPAVAAANAKRAHNEVLQTVAELGLAGAFLVVLLGVELFRASRRRARRFLAALTEAADPAVKREVLARFNLFRAALAGVVALLVIGQFTFPFHLPTGSSLALLLLAVAMRQGDELEGDRGGISVSTRLRWPLLALGVLVTGAALVASVAQYQAEVAVKTAEKALLAGRGVDEVLAAIDEGRAWNPWDGRLYFLRGLALQKRADKARRRGDGQAVNQALRAAVRAYREADRHFGDVAIPANMGHCLLGLRDFDGAREALQRALAMDPTHLMVLRLLAAVDGLSRGPEAALPWLRRAMALDAADDEVRNAYWRTSGQVHMKHRRARAAADSFASAIAANPDDLEARFGWAQAEALDGHHDKAKVVLEEILRRRPESLPAHSVMARVLAVLGEDEDAEAHARFVLERRPGDEEMTRLLGLLERRRAARRSETGS